MKLDDLKKKAAELAQSGAAKSRQLAAIAKLKAVNLAEEDAIRKAYIELGKQYFAMYGEHPEDEFIAACNIIKESQATIAANNDMINEIKSANNNEDVIESVLDEMDEETDVEEMETEETVEAEAESPVTEAAPEEDVSEDETPEEEA